MIGDRDALPRGGGDIAVVATTPAEVICLAPVIDAFALEPRVITGHSASEARRAMSVARTAEALAGEFSRHRPGALVVHGSSPTGIVAAHVAADDGIPVVHAESGLGADWSPPGGGHPSLAVHAAPSIRAAAQLRRAAVDPATISVTGSTVVESTRAALVAHGDQRDRDLDHVPIHHGFVLAVLDHSRGAETLERTLHGLAAVEGVCLLLASAETSALPDRHALARVPRDIVVLPELPHRSVMRLARRAALLVSDSVALQEECTVLGVRLLALRPELDRPEAAEAGFVRPLRAHEDLVEAITAELRDEDARERLRARPTPFGDGRSAARIAALAQFLADGSTAAEAVSMLDETHGLAAPYPPVGALVPSAPGRI